MPQIMNVANYSLAQDISNWKRKKKKEVSGLGF